MLKLNIAVLFYLILTLSCKGQSMEIDTFSDKLKINDQIVFNEDTKQEVRNIFGAPDNITTEYWEMSDETITTYHYNNGAKFDFSNGIIKSFKLTSPQYYLNLNSFKLQVGNKIASISNKFPQSYEFRSSSGTSIALGSGDYRYLYIKFDDEDTIISIEERIF